MSAPRVASLAPVALVVMIGAGLLLPACSDDTLDIDGNEQSVPGPVRLESDEQLDRFLASGRFSLVGGADDWWELDSDGTFRAQLDGVLLEGRWTTEELRLLLTDLTADGEPLEDSSREYPIEWIDGKLNIGIGDRQYRKFNP